MKNDLVKNPLRIGSLILAFMTIAFTSNAQTGMEEYFYESGKIRVVIAVATVVLIGIIVYVWMLNRRITKIERKK